MTRRQAYTEEETRALFVIKEHNPYALWCEVKKLYNRGIYSAKRHRSEYALKRKWSWMIGMDSEGYPDR